MHFISVVYLFTHKYLLRAYCKPSTMPSPGDTEDKEMFAFTLLIA